MGSSPTLPNLRGPFPFCDCMCMGFAPLLSTAINRDGDIGKLFHTFRDPMLTLYQEKCSPDELSEIFPIFLWSCHEEGTTFSLFRPLLLFRLRDLSDQNLFHAVRILYLCCP